MSSTISLQNSVDFSQPFYAFRPLTIGVGNEPAITAGNIVKQTMLGAPFVWKWNRVKTSGFTTTAGTQDYSVALSDFGFLEKISLINSGTALEIPGIRNALGASTTDQNVPQTACPLLDDNAGNITFRLLSAPDKVYTSEIIYQKKATLFSSLSNTWSPIPDEYSFVYNQGFLAMAGIYVDDPRWGINLQRFLAMLLSVSEGLDEMQKNAFLETWNLAVGNQQALLGKVQLGTQARGSR